MHSDLQRKNGRFRTIPFLRSSARFVYTVVRPSGFHFFGFRNSNFYSSKVVSLAFNPQSGEIGPVFMFPSARMWPSYIRSTGFPFRRLYDSQGYTVKLF
jgi:hypothetical protein